MPEGHSVRRLARQFGDVFGGRRLSVSSPQGRFREGAALLDGHTLLAAEAHGKHLFLHFDNALVLHVHLGLYGAWSFGGDSTFNGSSSIGAPRRVGEQESFADGNDDDAYSGPPAPVGAVRVRLAASNGWADLRGATTCEAITLAETDLVRARLGPDPLVNRRGDAGRFAANLLGRKAPVAALLMDQKIIAGVGNVYRAEVLFRRRLDPWLPGSNLADSEARKLWRDVVSVMNDGVADGRIITTTPRYWTANGKKAKPAAEAAALKSSSFPARDNAHFVYKRDGLPCRVCRTTVLAADLVGRRLYWCPSCQA
ncbi:endonuclease-8/formamidopyrimidine-DNA glycosylase [Pseudarthrobacter oxydans]|uniref:DNA-(apurinic or apyrimidinic site) lyase n=1 Tax=Pseudarthrobacter oxydans TaxID=1671 RepID=A0AAW8NA55_PSEOX|nr:DNA-formamidopyrimidine glycosylase family protein [Pseudarthrobacter oxydans]MDR6793100.1 endonuclease-8/formamidopyrimidine-DNA glycosylase [Pseudarthrobacter oxydans]MDR7164371.1 endonuclease-8/formamidopyrimidine-DNA glycosylase [Pseudarthrobacter oxydans]